MLKYIANVLTGCRVFGSILLLFLLPLTMPFLKLNYAAIVVCAPATVSAIQEGVSLIKDGESKQSACDFLHDMIE